jgi:hypothetical protein
MTHVIGLFPHGLKDDRSFVDLRSAGFNPAKIGMMSEDQVIWEVFGSKQGRVIAAYTGLGALAGFVIYGIFALLASWCQCYLFQSDTLVQWKTFLGGILAGMFVGSSLGLFVGISKLEELIALYSQGRQINGKLVEVQVSGKRANQVKNVLEQDGACEVKII